MWKYQPCIWRLFKCYGESCKCMETMWFTTYMICFSKVKKMFPKLLNPLKSHNKRSQDASDLMHANEHHQDDRWESLVLKLDNMGTIINVIEESDNRLKWSSYEFASKCCYIPMLVKQLTLNHGLEVKASYTWRSLWQNMRSDEEILYWLSNTPSIGHVICDTIRASVVRNV